IAVARAVRENRIIWSNELTALLEHLPAQGGGERPSIDFRTLNMQAVDSPRSDPTRFEGAPAVAAMSGSGTVVDTETLARFIAALEDSAEFGVSFQNASRTDETGHYTYNLVVGALGGAQ